jgi:hypothetical protein
MKSASNRAVACLVGLSERWNRAHMIDAGRGRAFYLACITRASLDLDQRPARAGARRDRNRLFEPNRPLLHDLARKLRRALAYRERSAPDNAGQGAGGNCTSSVADCALHGCRPYLRATS